MLDRLKLWHNTAAVAITSTADAIAACADNLQQNTGWVKSPAV